MIVTKETFEQIFSAISSWDESQRTVVGDAGKNLGFFDLRPLQEMAIAAETLDGFGLLHGAQNGFVEKCAAILVTSQINFLDSGPTKMTIGRVTRFRFLWH